MVTIRIFSIFELNNIIFTFAYLFICVFLVVTAFNIYDIDKTDFNNQEQENIVHLRLIWWLFFKYDKQNKTYIPKKIIKLELTLYLAILISIGGFISSFFITSNFLKTLIYFCCFLTSAGLGAYTGIKYRKK